MKKKLVFSFFGIIIIEERVLWWNSSKTVKGELNMKKLMMVVAVAALAFALTGCGSLRTPTKGPRSKNVYYNTFFGISLESLVYGDGVIVGQK